MPARLAPARRRSDIGLLQTDGIGATAGRPYTCTRHCCQLWPELELGRSHYEFETCRLILIGQATGRLLTKYGFYLLSNFQHAADRLTPHHWNVLMITFMLTLTAPTCCCHGWTCLSGRSAQLHKTKIQGEFNTLSFQFLLSFLRLTNCSVHTEQAAFSFIALVKFQCALVVAFRANR